MPWVCPLILVPTATRGYRRFLRRCSPTATPLANVACTCCLGIDSLGEVDDTKAFAEMQGWKRGRRSRAPTTGTLVAIPKGAFFLEKVGLTTSVIYGLRYGTQILTVYRDPMGTPQRSYVCRDERDSRGILGAALVGL